MPRNEQITPAENESDLLRDAHLSINIQAEENADVVADSTQAQAESEREAALILRRIGRLSQTRREGSETLEEHKIEHQNNDLEAISRVLDELFEIAKRRSKNLGGFRDQLKLLVNAPKDFIVEMKALVQLRQLRGELEKTFTSQESRDGAIQVLDRLINGMDEERGINTHFSPNADIEKKLRSYGTGILFDNQEVLLESLKDPNPDTEKAIAKILSRIGGQQYPSKRRPSKAEQKTVDFLEKLLPSINKRIEILKQNPQGGDFAEYYANALHSSVLQADPEKRAVAQEAWFDALLLGKNPERQKDILAGYVFSYDKTKEQKRGVLRYLLERTGLDPEKFYDADKNKKGEIAKDDNYLKNILAVLALESSMPGSVSKLAREYGILSFARYPKGALLRQLETEDNLEMPYGIILNPREDWNGGYYGDIYVFSDFSDSAREGKMNVRIFECESKKDAVNKLMQLNQKYGAREKIQFAIIGGHGDATSLEFGQENRRTINAKALKKKAMQELREYFSQDATIVLNSCSTGDDFGLGETMSRLAKIKVIAYDRPTRLRSLKVAGGGAVTVEYKETADGSLRVYVSGELKEGERSKEAKEIEALF